MQRFWKTLFCLLALLVGGYASAYYRGSGVENHQAVRLEATTLDAGGASSSHGLSVFARTLAPQAYAQGSPVIELILVNTRNVRRTIGVSLVQEGSSVRTVTLEPLASATVAFNLPRIASERSWMTEDVAVRFTEGTVSWFGGRVETAGERAFNRESYLNLLVTPSLDAIGTVEAYSREDEAEKGKKAGKGKKFLFSTQAMGAEGWSADGRAYSCYDLIWLTAEDWQALAPGVRRALVGYAVQGGALILSGATEIPAEAKGFPARANRRPDEEKEGRTVGSGFIGLAPALGAGRQPSLPRATLERLGTDSRLRQEERLALDGGATAALIMRKMPLEDLPSVPASFFMLLLAAFALVLVPTVLVLSVRRGQRLRALVVLPLVSLAVGLVAVIGILSVFGVTPRLFEKTEVCLNAADRRAVVQATAGLFTPRDVTDNLRFSRTANVAVIGIERPGFDVDEGHNLCLAEGDERTATGGSWMKTLRPVLYVTTDVRDTTARLEIEAPDADRIKVTNLLGAPLVKLVAVDAKGRAFVTTDLAEGETREVTVADGGLVEATLPSPRERPRPGAYRAELTGSPFLPDTLGGTKAKRSAETIVYGSWGKESAE